MIQPAAVVAVVLCSLWGCASGREAVNGKPHQVVDGRGNGILWPDWWPAEPCLKYGLAIHPSVGVPVGEISDHDVQEGVVGLLG